MSKRVLPGDTIMVTGESGHRSFVQLVGDGRYRQLVRVFYVDGIDSAEELDLESLLRGEEAYAIEINWRDLRNSAEARTVGRFPIPPGREVLPPMRMFVAKSESNPDGWMVKDANGSVFSGAEYRALFPEVIQSSLSVTDIPMTDTFLRMLNESWRPRRESRFLLD